MIDTTIANWHTLLRGRLDGGFDALLDEDCVFYSPVLFTPQRGRDLVKLYLEAAVPMLSAAVRDDQDGGAGAPTFGYVKEVLSHPYAVLEFESKIGDTLINGVDIITCGDDDRIIEFKVMLRPLRAVTVVQEQMARLLAQATEGS